MMEYRTSYVNPVLEQHVLQTQRLCERNNNIGIPEDITTLNGLFKQPNENLAAIVGHLGKNSFAHLPFYCIMGCNIWLGDDVSLNNESVHTRGVTSIDVYVLLTAGPVSIVVIYHWLPSGTARPLAHTAGL